MATNDNRVRFVDYDIENDRATWDELHGCKATTTTGKQTESEKAIWPPFVDPTVIGGKHDNQVQDDKEDIGRQ